MPELNQWTIQRLLTWTIAHFSSKQIASARLDAELLLAQTLKCKRLDLYMRFDQPLTPEELSEFKGYVQRRSSFEPVAYIRGAQEFYGLDFIVNKNVLIPRPETELLIDEILKWQAHAPEKAFSILEIGSGSGCIAITLAQKQKNCRVTAIDISEPALRTARENATRHGVNDQIEFLQTSYEDYSTLNVYDIVCSNPPYIARSAQNLSAGVREFEPEKALFGGEVGYETIENWLPKMISHLAPGGLLVFEFGFDQKSKVIELLKSNQLDGAEVLNDFSGHPRIARATKKLKV